MSRRDMPFEIVNVTHHHYTSLHTITHHYASLHTITRSFTSAYTSGETQEKFSYSKPDRLGMEGGLKMTDTIDGKTLSKKIAEALALRKGDTVEIQVDKTNPSRVLVLRHVNSDSKSHQPLSSRSDSCVRPASTNQA